MLIGKYHISKPRGSQGPFVSSSSDAHDSAYSKKYPKIFILNLNFKWRPIRPSLLQELLL